MARLICNSIDNRETEECTCCGKVHHEYVHQCKNCNFLNVVTSNMPATCGRCGKGIDTDGGGAK
jgi:hypothetical protein